MGAPAHPDASRKAPRAAGAKANTAWLMTVKSATMRPTSPRGNSVCAMGGGSEVKLPMPCGGRSGGFPSVPALPAGDGAFLPSLKRLAHDGGAGVALDR